ncbi:hypothetical protein [Methanomassiliicoccus luminyensis]|uniref:hypothetical protein n=1 Tax=Methanomassiliicoccus luminyensis TaxID=1080712 RepID=UPI0011C9307A|nr:hypothetical protein [Methanomassiliicoccus luminyensis]
MVLDEGCMAHILNLAVDTSVNPDDWTVKIMPDISYIRDYLAREICLTPRSDLKMFTNDNPGRATLAAVLAKPPARGDGDKTPPGGGSGPKIGQIAPGKYVQ